MLKAYEEFSLLQGTPSSSIEATQRLVACGGVWSSSEFLVQLPESVTHIGLGSMKGRWEGAEHAALKPARPTPLTCSVMAGMSLKLKLAQLPGQATPRLLARCNGAFLADIKVHFLLLLTVAERARGKLICEAGTKVWGFQSRALHLGLDILLDVNQFYLSFAALIKLQCAEGAHCLP